MSIKFTGELTAKGDIPNGKLMDSQVIDFSGASGTLGLSSLTAENSTTPDATDFFVVVDDSGNQKKVKMSAVDANNFNVASLEGDVQSVNFKVGASTATAGTGGDIALELAAGSGLSATLDGNNNKVTIGYDVDALATTSPAIANDKFLVFDSDDANLPKVQTMASIFDAIDGNGLSWDNSGGKLNLDLKTSAGLTFDGAELALDGTGLHNSDGSVGSATEIPVITTNEFGQVTDLTTAAVASTLTFKTDTNVANGVDLLSETLEILGGDSIEVTNSGDVITIALPETITVDEIDHGDVGVGGTFKLWDQVTGNINIGTSGSTTTFGGSVAASQGFSSISANNFIVDDNTIVIDSNAGADDFGGDGSNVDGAIVFAGLDIADKNVQNSCKIVCDTDGFKVNNVTRAAIVASHLDSTTYANAIDAGFDATAGGLACFKGAGFVFDSVNGDAIQGQASNNSDGTMVWDGTELYIFDAS